MMRFSETFIEDLRDRITISDVIGSRVTWDRKKTKPSRGDWWGCCPFHGENSPSFHCEDRKGRYHCFGCGVSGDHFRFFMELDGVSFPRAVEMVADLAGVSFPTQREETPQERAERERRQREREQRKAAQQQAAAQEAEEKAETVRGIWAGAVPIEGKLAESYLIGRGVPKMAWPPSIRFHPGLAYGRERHPALVCGVQSVDRKLVAVWRIFLRPDGSALTDSDGRKIKVGLGPAGGGAVRLGPAGEEINVCEGVETGFGVGCLTRWKRSVWPLLSTSGMIGWEPPPGVKRVGIYADGDRYKVKPTGQVSDPPGRVAAHKLRERLIAKGIEAVVYEPPPGSDWLDVWNTTQTDTKRTVLYPED